MAEPVVDVNHVDIPALARWLTAHAPSLPTPRRARLLSGGRSNVTVELETDAEALVLRRPPFGHVMQTAHDMRREYRVQSALGRLGFPVPPMRALVDDGDGSAGVGVTFYLMGRIDGALLATPADNMGWRPEALRAASLELARYLAKLHDVDIAAAGLADFGRPDGYLERQLARWSRQLETSTSRPLPTLHALAKRLAPAPDTRAVAVVHGDYKINNALLEPGSGRLVALLDWEMSTLGDPFLDLALFALYWQMPSLDPVLREVFESPVDFAAGYPQFQELFDAYREALHLVEVPAMGWYLAFAAFKLAVITESLHFRFLTGGTVGEGFERIGEMTPILAALGHDVIDGRELIAGE